MQVSILTFYYFNSIIYLNEKSLIFKQNVAFLYYSYMTMKSYSPELRDLQSEALDKIEAAIESGAKHIFLNAPTGSGKSIINIELAKRLGIPSFILTHERSLQEQYEETIEQYLKYNDVQNISSAQNYICSKTNKNVKDFAKCTRDGKNIWDASFLDCSGSCDYHHRRIDAPVKNITVTNYAYYFKQMNYTYDILGLGMEYKDLDDLRKDYQPVHADGNRVAPFIPRPLVIMDEAHRLPDQAQSAFEFEWGVGPLNKFVEAIKSCGKAGHYLPVMKFKWAKMAEIIGEITGTSLDDNRKHIKLIKRTRNWIKPQRTKLFNQTNDFVNAKWVKKDKPIPKEVTDLIYEMRNIENAYCRMDDIIGLISEHGLENLVVGYSSKGNRKYNLLSDRHVLKSALFPYGEIFIYTSATLGDIDVLAERMGIREYVKIDVDPNWNYSNSPVYYTKTANFSNKNKEESLLYAKRVISNILYKHQGEMGVIHTGTYEFAEMLSGFDRIMTYSNTEEKIRLLERINIGELPTDTVLAGPSLFEGIDLPGDLCRFQVVTKLQYPNLQDRLWAKRCYGSQKKIYNDKPFSDLIQAIGRGVRYDGDHSTTYLLDERFVRYIKNKEAYLPPGWKNRFNLMPVGERMGLLLESNKLYV